MHALPAVLFAFKLFWDFFKVKIFVLETRLRNSVIALLSVRSHTQDGHHLCVETKQGLPVRL